LSSGSEWCVKFRHISFLIKLRTLFFNGGCDCAITEAIFYEIDCYWLYYLYKLLFGIKDLNYVGCAAVGFAIVISSYTRVILIYT
jgi:hypothetical protein